MKFTIPENIPQDDVLRICDQLNEAGLIEWQGIEGDNGYSMMGNGKIRAAGTDAIDGKDDSALPLNFNLFTQNINASGNATVQAAGHGSIQNQTVTQHVEQLIRAIDAAPVSEAEKQEAKSKIGELLKTKAADAVFGVGTAMLMRMLGL